MYYLGTKILGLSEEEFMRSTPKKLFSIAKIHSDMNNPKEQENAKKPDNKEVYIDDLF